LDGEYRWEERVETLARTGLCPPQTIKTLRRYCGEMLKIKTRPSLNHGDLRLKNVIADEGGKIVAVIDWDKAVSTIAPHWELSLALHDLGVDRQEQFVEGYGLKPKRLADIAPYVKVFNLLNYTDEVNRVIAAKDKLGLARLRARFAGTFDLYTL
ncbi:MAG: aminoglycoside phosphotransferase family protein, partial [Blastocatellia bacterium]|nr:aminoglycoside phosphotransferase family protein [Blastocatellia bacterium]